MNFNSWQFLVFFPIAAAGYFILTMKLFPRREAVRTTLVQFYLLALSLFFYACWNPAYLALIVISVIVTWCSGIVMDGRSVQQKRLVLIGSLVVNLGILCFFKYYHFFTDSIQVMSRGYLSFPVFNVLLPLGISFYTFQAIGYSIDVFYGRTQAERNIVTYALFVTFFPLLVAGPIERTNNLLPQFKINHVFDYDRVTSGLKLAAWGMFKKVVIADRLAIYVNAVYTDPSAYPAATLALATFFFAFQIYCDFSGYSDIALGTARVLGFNPTNNFRQPYFSRSIAEFWRRWHISLSSWLRDYIYIPLGGNRKGAFRQKLNLGITFLLSGLWHGASWHFVAWGALHGGFQIIGRSTSPVRSAIAGRIGLGEESRLRKLVQVCITFVLVCFAWIFFRANTIHDAFVICAKLTHLPAELAEYARQLSPAGIMDTIRTAFSLTKAAVHPIEDFGLTKLGLAGITILLLLVYDRWSSIVPAGISRRMPLVIRWAGYYALILAILSSWDTGSTQFIYFTF